MSERLVPDIHEQVIAWPRARPLLVAALAAGYDIEVVPMPSRYGQR